jgi:hypothetical protein
MAPYAPGAQDATIAVRDTARDVPAVRLAPSRDVVEGHARLEDVLASREGTHIEGAADLRVLESRELPHEERAPLALGQRAKVREQRREAFPGQAAALGVGVIRGVGRELLIGVTAAQDRDRLVVGDAVKPRADHARGAAALKRAEHGEHRVLERVPRVLGIPHDRAAVARQRIPMTLVQRREGIRVTGAGELRQALIGKRPMRKEAKRRERLRRGYGPHAEAIGRRRPELEGKE